MIVKKQRINAYARWLWFCIPTINSDNQLDTFVNNSPYQNKDDESDNETFNEELKWNSDDEEEQLDFDEWFAEQMGIHQKGSEKSTDKEEKFVNFLDSITSNSMMD